MTYKILITDDLSPQSLIKLEEMDDVTFDVVRGLTPEALAKQIPEYDALIVYSTVTVTEAVFAAANKLKVVGRAGVGIDNIDIKAASMRGVIVMNTPGANTIATTEHTMALMLAMCRHLPQAHTSMKTGEWNRKVFVGRQLYRKTIGIVGMGRIGTRVARRCQAFGMEVIAYDPYLSDDVAHKLKIKPVDLNDLLSQADFISLHAAHTEQTANLINRENIAKMKDGVRIVNAARGGLIDTDALVEALKSGKIAGAALDVFIEEPLAKDSPLLELDNVILTPHLAASTIEAQRDVGTQVVDQVLDALRGKDFRNALNMPIGDVDVLKTLQPYLSVAEKVGSLHAQLADAAINRIEIEIKGREVRDHIKPITVAILKGLLSPVLVETINYINAPLLARKRGIAVSETQGLPTIEYPNIISCRVAWDGGEQTMAVTLFNEDEPRLVQMDKYRLDVRPDGVMLVIGGIDIPGFIGHVGTLLGKHNINIAAFRNGRDKPLGNTLSFLRVDADVPDSVMDALRSLDSVVWVKKVILD
ncbi:phosphoglycerate dehydrogenase [Anaerolineales bacterium HSG25]|nr:phosphoglycerate dehydrogenase [Anaerolineales bacterium HSG25]